MEAKFLGEFWNKFSLFKISFTKRHKKAFPREGFKNYIFQTL